MQPYRAEYTYIDHRKEGRPTISEPVIVVGMWEPAPWIRGDGMVESSGLQLLAVSQVDGRHISSGTGSFTATEPTYLNQPEPKGHEHEFPIKGEPVIEAGRLAGMRYVCACGEERTDPTGGQVRVPG
jgi:hypothetical protein